MTPAATMPFESKFEVHFRSLLRRGFELIFPCDRDGRVDLDALSERAMANYLFARAMVGREYANPAVLQRRECDASESAGPARWRLEHLDARPSSRARARRPPVLDD